MTTFHGLLRSAAELHGDRTAILFEDRSLSFADMLARAESLAAGLAAQGVTPGDRLAIIMDNSLECVLAWFAGNLIGCADVPLNPQYRGELLHYLLNDSDASVLICDTHYLAQVIEITDRLPSLRLVIVNGAAAHEPNKGLTVLDLAACETGLPFAQPPQADERIVLYTSGTTGPSKGVVHSQRAMMVLSQYNAQVLGNGPEDRLLNFFPLFHQNARYTGVMPALCTGASIRIERKLSTSTFWQTCDRDGITAFNYLGSVLRMILNVTPPERRAGTHTITKAFGAGASAGLWVECEERLGIRLYETYGLTEAPMATINVPGPARCPPGSAGRGSELFEVAVFDENDNQVPPGEVGEIVLRPRRADAVMQGYLNKDEATVEAFRNLWFHSGDRGYLSEDGDLFFEERRKDSIRRRGENISAWEVESVVERHPGVAEAAAYGVRSEDVDEEVAVSLVLSDEGAGLADIHAFARKHLPSYAVPTLLRIVSDLPRTPTAKVKKDELRAVAREAYIDFATGPAEVPRTTIQEKGTR
ncbi:MAG: AMP-binding protein [Novosphingobium sp.]|nr:AMP-binding protein [Novosphingobium sp.]